MLHWKTSQVHWTTSQAMVNMAPLFRVLVQYQLPCFNRGQVVDTHLTTREAILIHLNQNIVAAQERIKLQVDKKRTDRECLLMIGCSLGQCPISINHQQLEGISSSLLGSFDLSNQSKKQEKCLISWTYHFAPSLKLFCKGEGRNYRIRQSVQF